MTPSLRQLRLYAVAQSLMQSASLEAAIDRAGFVQADPIRAPATAQDLILRHRVEGYRAGDLDRRYPSLSIEEGVLYAYGLLPRPIWHLAHPPTTKGLTKLDKKILDAVHTLGQAHPNDLATTFGRNRTLNAWGGHCKVTTLALDALCCRGLLRVARREKGVRVYEPAVPAAEPTSPVEALRRLVLIIATILAPAPEKSLREAASRLRRLASNSKDIRAVLDELIRRGQLCKQAVDGVDYVWPAREMAEPEEPRSVRFLAPFDPLVWDRRRFEHFWGWSYRFEAYTPPAKRLRGYYAMPLLWADRVIGWANASVRGGRLHVELGYIGQRPKGNDFRAAMDAEIHRMETFLQGNDPRQADRGQADREGHARV